MKKKVLASLAAALLLFLLAVPTCALETDTFIFDVDGYLGEAAAEELNAAAQEFSLRHDCGIYAAIFNDMSDYGYYDIEAFSEAVYLDFELGCSEDLDGVLLVLSMAERDFDLVSYGDYADRVFSGYVISDVEDAFLDNFRMDDWVGGVTDYIFACDRALEAGIPESSEEDWDYGDYSDYGYEYDFGAGGAYRASESIVQRLAHKLPIGAFAGVCAALVYCTILKRKMISAKSATEADRYVCEHGVAMRAAMDQFSHTTVVRQHIDRDSGSRSSGGSHGGGGGGGGFSHHSGKF